MKFPRSSFNLVVLILVGLLVGGGFWGLHSLRQTFVIVEDAYAQEWTATFVIEHLKANSNKWPSCWDDLHDEYQRLNDPQTYPFTWEKLQDRVVVDWKADPLKLLHANASDSPPFLVVRLSDGSKHNWEGGEPNQMILSYLLASANPTQEPSNSHSVRNMEAASSTNE